MASICWVLPSISVQQQCAAPDFSPNAGNYTSNQTIYLSCATTNSSIYYTLDGTTPSSASTLYSALYPIQIAAGTTAIKAIAYAPNYTPSNVTGGSYSITYPTLSAPTFSPNGGSFSSTQTVTISASSGASIFYAINSGSYTLYSAPISVSVSEIVYAYASQSQYQNSSTSSATFTISSAAIYPSMPGTILLTNQGGSGNNNANTQEISWGAATAGTYPIASYRIQRAQVTATGIGSYSTIYTTANAATLSYTDTSATNSNYGPNNGSLRGVIPSTQYTYQVAAIDTQGNVGAYQTAMAAYIYQNGSNCSESAYLNGVSINWTDTAGNPPVGPYDIYASYSGSGQFLPYTNGPLSPQWDFQIGAFNYMTIDIKCASSNVALVISCNSRLGGNFNSGPYQGDVYPGSQIANIFSGQYGTFVANQWCTYVFPLTAVTMGFGVFVGSISYNSSVGYLELTVTSTTSGAPVDSGGYITGSGLPAGLVTIPQNTYPTSYGPGVVYYLLNPSLSQSTYQSISVAAGTTLYYQRTEFYKPKIGSVGAMNCYINNIGFLSSGQSTGTPITPFIEVDGAWSQENTVTVTQGTSISLGPQPISGTWSWTGPNGFTSNSREIDNIPLSVGTNVYTATYTNPSGYNTNEVFTITVTSGTATSTKTALQNYFATIQSSGKYLSGQHSQYFDFDYTSVMSSVESINTQTGQYPAILGVGYITMTNFGGYPPTTIPAQQLSYWWGKGGIVELTFWSNAPVSNPSSVTGSLDATDFHNITVSGTSQYNTWQAALASFFSWVQTQVSGGNTLLIRPFTECNGSWEWWGAQNGADFIALWMSVWNYAENLGLNSNILWIWNINIGVGNYTTYWPGSQYVDIVAIDAYVSTSSGMASAIEGCSLSTLISYGKPIMLAETSNEPADMSNPSTSDFLALNALQTVAESYSPQFIGYVYWCQNAGLDGGTDLESLMTNSATITLDQLPSNIAIK